MQRLDRLHIEFPFAGSRLLRYLLALRVLRDLEIAPPNQVWIMRCKIGRRHEKTLMRRMGIEAPHRRPRNDEAQPGHRSIRIYITYIPMAHGFIYLTVVLDWAIRSVLSWRLSITMEAAFFVKTLEDALARHGRPGIFKPTEASQSTGSAFTGLLAAYGIAISMAGNGSGRTMCSSNGFGAASNTRRF